LTVRFVLACISVSLLVFSVGCGVKMSQVPVVSYPYVSEFEFFKDVRNVDGKAKKIKFKDGRIVSPFCFFVKVSEVENNGVVRVVFYEGKEKKGTGEEKNKKLAEYTFDYGEEGKYYEYILFFDRVDSLGVGKYRYAVMINNRLLFEGSFDVREVVPAEGVEH